MNPTLLLVDDEPAIRDRLSSYCRRLGYLVFTAGSAPEALERLSTSHVDLVLADTLLPDMPGAELCERVRVSYPMTRVIMLAGPLTLESAVACLRNGADAVVSKFPEDLKELEEAVERSIAIIQRWAEILTDLATRRVDHGRDASKGGTARRRAG
jgi:CheY-like chemotaxis protein